MNIFIRTNNAHSRRRRRVHDGRQRALHIAHIIAFDRALERGARVDDTRARGAHVRARM
jgi:hypothetical protein